MTAVSFKDFLGLGGQNIFNGRDAEMLLFHRIVVGVDLGLGDIESVLIQHHFIFMEVLHPFVADGKEPVFRDAHAGAVVHEAV